MSPDERTSALEPFESALRRLEDALEQAKTEWTRDASIQRFEYTFELAWKSVARFARREGIESPSPRQAIRAALRLEWIEDNQLWLDMLEDRNRTSHIYNERMAEDIYARLSTYQGALFDLLGRLKQLE